MCVEEMTGTYITLRCFVKNIIQNILTWRQIFELKVELELLSFHSFYLSNISTTLDRRS